jgi:hypothetical protein
VSLQNPSDAEDRACALTLARSGDYENWQGICRKMLFDGWGIEIFNESAFTHEIDTICARARADQRTG